MCCKRLYWRDVSSAVALSPILCGPSGGASARSTTSSVDPLEAPPTGPPVLGNRIFLAVLYQKSDRRSQKLFFFANIFIGRDSVSQCCTVFPVKMATKQDILHFEWLFYGRHCRAVFHANFSCGCAANLLQVCGTTGMLCFNLDCPAVVVWLPGLKLSYFVNYTCVAGSFSEEM